MWQRLFDGGASALGKSLRLNDHLYQVVGVMPPRFGWWTDDGFWMPIGKNEPANRRRIVPIARLKEGVTAAAAQAQVHAFHEALAKEGSEIVPREEFRTRLVNYMDMTVASGDMERNLWLLFGAVVLLLAIACANVANLQLARSSTRAREMAIRASIGANRWDLIRQLLTESVVISLAGGAVGLLLAFWTTQGIARLIPGNFVPNEARIEINLWVLAFCCVVSVVTGILFGLAPALEVSKVDLTESLKDSTSSSGGSRRGIWTRKGLVVIEVALSVVLLLAAGLTIRTFIALQSVELGFRPQNVIVAGVQLLPTRYTTLQQRNQFGTELLQRVKRIPGVTAASLGNGGTPFNGFNSDVTIEGRADGERRQMDVVLAGAEYLKAMAVPLVNGREFTEREVADGAPLAIVNQTALAEWAPGEGPVGKRVKLDVLLNPGRLLKQENTTGWVTVVGVMGDTRSGLRERARPLIVLPFTLLAPVGRTLVVRASTEPAALINSIREQIKQMDREQPLGRPATMLEIIQRQTVQPRFTMALFGAFAVLGLALAAFRIYSVLSYFVAQRTRELGVRMALGAQYRDVLALVLFGGSKLLLIGLVIGIAGGFFCTRLLSGQLFGVSANDPVTFIAVALTLAAVALIACYVPARRAAGVNPIEALRYE
jgi:predicted permease